MKTIDNEIAVAYRCIDECRLDGTNFDYDEIIEIPVENVPNDWKGTEFYDHHPYEFERVYADQCFTVEDESGQEDEIMVVGEKEDAEEKYKAQSRWNSFFDFCQMELPNLYEH